MSQKEIELYPNQPRAWRPTPTDMTIYLGSSVPFSSNIQGGKLPYSCQWYVGGIPISGATSSSFTYTPPAVGTYYVYLNVTDDRGRVAKSNTAKVLVETPPAAGGYSVGFGNANLSSRIACYSALIFVFAAGVSTIRHKRIPK